MEEKDNIELRSEKVRNIIGKVPPRLVRTGTVVITLVLIALAVAAYKIPYPLTVEAQGVVQGDVLRMTVPYRYLYLFNTPRQVRVSYEGNPDKEYNYAVTHYSPAILHTTDGNLFEAYANIKGTQGVHRYQKASVRIVISDKTLWQQICRE